MTELSSAWPKGSPGSQRHHSQGTQEMQVLWVKVREPCWNSQNEVQGRRRRHQCPNAYKESLGFPEGHPLQEAAWFCLQFPGRLWLGSFPSLTWRKELIHYEAFLCSLPSQILWPPNHPAVGGPGGQSGTWGQAAGDMLSSDPVAHAH